MEGLKGGEGRKEGKARLRRREGNKRPLVWGEVRKGMAYNKKRGEVERIGVDRLRRKEKW